MGPARPLLLASPFDARARADPSSNTDHPLTERGSGDPLNTSRQYQELIRVVVVTPAVTQSSLVERANRSGNPTRRRGGALFLHVGASSPVATRLQASMWRMSAFLPSADLKGCPTIFATTMDRAYQPSRYRSSAPTFLIHARLRRCYGPKSVRPLGFGQKRTNSPLTEGDEAQMITSGKKLSLNSLDLSS